MQPRSAPLGCRRSVTKTPRGSSNRSLPTAGLGLGSDAPTVEATARRASRTAAIPSGSVCTPRNGGAAQRFFARLGAWPEK